MNDMDTSRSFFTFLGTGTSTGIPEIGCSCEVCTSNDPKDRRLRASLLISSYSNQGSIHICIDAGPDFREQMLRAKVDTLAAILLTHEHYDHVGGLDDIRPLFRNRPDCPLYLEAHLAKVLKERMPYAFREERYPGAPKYDLRLIEPGKEFQVNGSIKVLPLRVMHGKMPIVGFKVGNMAYLTDVKTLPQETIAAIQGIDYLILDGLRFYEHMSHLSIAEAVAIGREVEAKNIYLTHMAHTVGLHEKIENKLYTEYRNVHLAYDGLRIPLKLQ